MRSLLAPFVLLAGCGDAAPPPPVAPAPPPPASASAAATPPPPSPLLHTLAAAGDTTCVARGGAVLCLGAPVGRASALFESTGRTKPTPVAGIDDAVSVSLGRNVGCALRRGGAVACWGAVDDGTLAPRPARGAYAPRVVEGALPIAGVVATQIAAGGDFACAVRAGGDVVCWGMNEHGQLGDASVTGRLTPAPVAGIDDALEVAAGDMFACARRRSGDVWCWGGATGPRDDPSPRAFAPYAGATRIASTGNHACVLRANGDVVCAVPSGSAPAHVDPFGAIDLAVGGDMACGLLASGAVHCAGQADVGQLGRAGERVFQDANATVAGVNGAVEIAAGASHACALEKSGALRCWGSNRYGQLGIDPRTSVGAPHDVDGIDDAVRIAIAAGTSCAVRRSGNVACWGSDVGGALGNGDDGADPNGFDHFTTKPLAVSGIDDATDVAAGASHVCVVRRGGKVSCWGDDHSGQVGDAVAATEPRTTPFEVPNVADAVDIDANGISTCVARRSGRVTCWGTPPDVHTPGLAQAWTGPGAGTLDGVADAVRVGAQDDRGCVVRRSGRIACWGFEADAARDPKTPKRAVVELRGVTDAVQIAVGDNALVLLRSGDVRELDLARAFRRAPEKGATSPLGALVVPSTRLVSRSIDEACFVQKSGLVACLDGGKLSTPGVADGVDVASGGGTHCAVRTSGKVACWGTNDDGEAGVAPVLFSLLAVEVGGLPPAR